MISPELHLAVRTLLPREAPPEDLIENVEALDAFNKLLLETSHDCVLTLNERAEILFINERGAELLQHPSPTALLHRCWLESFAGSDRAQAERAFMEALSGSPSQFDAFAPTARGLAKWWQISLRKIPATSPGGPRILAVARDMTEHLQVEKALRESEEGFRKLFEEGPIGMLLTRPDLSISKVNTAFCHMVGYTEQELCGKRLPDLNHPDDAALDDENMRALLRGEISSFQIEKRCLTRRKSVFWTLLTVSLLRDAEGAHLHTVAMVENIDERKKSEQRFLAYQDQLQSLASELSLSEERARRKIATGLHDRIGQTLAFAKLKLGALSQNPGLRGSANLLQEIRELIEQSLADTRSLTFELSPPVLYELGLAAALEWLARRIRQEHGVRTRFHDDGQPKPLDDDLRIVLFQAVRELLVNVVKHARATHAQILLRRESDAIRLIVEDDGAGFDPLKVQPSSENSGFGLFSIRERLQYLGGEVKIRSMPGSGARVTLIAPLKLEPSP